MGGKQRWTPDEEQALRDGVDRYGPGKWRTIQKDPEYAARLAARSNVDLKDKWRNLTADPSQKAAAKHRASHGTSQRGRSRQRGSRGSAAARQNSEARRGVSTPRRRGSAMEAAAAAAVLMGTGGAGPSRGRGNGRAPVLGPKPEDMIIAAIISLGEPGGSHPDDMQDWIESQYSVAPDFGRVLVPTLQHMVETGRLDTSGGAGPGSHYRLATLKYAPQHSGDASASECNASMPSSSDMRGAFDQTAFEAAQRAAAAVAEAAEAAARADRLGDAAALFELAARQAEAESPTAGGNGGSWSIPQPKQEDEPG